MSVEVIVPPLGESIVEATVGRWLKSEGDSVAIGDPLVELETDKVNMEVAASVAGVLRRILRRVGETVAIGEPLAVISNGEEAAPPVASPSPQRVLSQHSERAAASVAQSVAPAIPVAPAVSAAPTIPETPASAQAHAEAEAARATPLARRLAEDEGVDLAAIHGTGPGGRVIHEDVTAYLTHRSNGAAGIAATAPAIPVPAATTAAASPAPPVAPSRPAAPASPPAPSAFNSGARVEERVPMSRRRMSIAANLVRAKQITAMLTTINEIDMSAVMELRKRRRDEFKERNGVGLGFMSFFTRAVVGALKAYSAAQRLD